MSRLIPPERVPTLTEVIAPGANGRGLSMPSATPAGEPASAEPLQKSIDLPTADSAEPVSADASLLAQSIAADLQAHIDRVLDARIHAALEPVLQQAISRVIEETRRELASTLRDGMARALAQQSSRHRNVP